jgi:DNA modification methylase
MKTEKIKIVEVKIGELKAADYNPRKWEQKAIDKLTENIKEFGFIDPVIANEAPKRKNIIIGGHFRVKVAKDLGYKEVPVVYVNIPDIKKEKELNMRLNKNTGDWDWKLLKDFEKDILEIVGFSSTELDKLFSEDDVVDDNFDPEEFADKIKTPKSKPGQVYQLGNHFLMCGDATDPDQVKKLLNGKKAAMVFTDPPYNVDYQGAMNAKNKNKREGILNDKMSAENFYEFLSKSVSNLIKNCNGALYICMGSSEMDTLKKAFVQGGGHFSSFIIWVKNAFTLSRSDWQSQYEPMLYYGWPAKVINHYFAGWRDEGNVWENLETLKPKFDGEKTTIKIGEFHLEINGPVTGQIIRKKDMVDIWREKKPTKSKEHPTMKPVKLVAKAIKASSVRDDIVLDTFGGSGSTLIACEELGRSCYMMELDPKYCDVIRERYDKFINKDKK